MNINDYPVQKRPLIKAINHVGSILKLSKASGMPRQFMYEYLKPTTKNPVPNPKFCAGIERATGGSITKKMLRPDVFGEDNCKKLTQKEKIDKGLGLLREVIEEIEYHEITAGKK